MNDSDDAAIGDGVPSAEEMRDLEEYEADQAEQGGGAAMPLDPQDGTNSYEGPREPTEAELDSWATSPTPREYEELEVPGPGRFYPAPGQPSSANGPDASLGTTMCRSCGQRVPAGKTPCPSCGAVSPHEGPPGPQEGGMPPLATWPGHEDCDPRGRVHDDVEGWVCSCGEVLGELPDAGQVEDAVARFGPDATPAEVQGRDPIVTVLPALELDQITPSEIERQLASIMARLELGSHFQRQVEVRAFTLRQDLDLATAKTITRLVEQGVKGDAAYRKSAAIVENEELYRDCMEAEELRRCVRETMHNLRSMQTGFQTIARSVGVSFGNPMQGVGGYAPR